MHYAEALRFPFSHGRTLAYASLVSMLSTVPAAALTDIALSPTILLVAMMQLFASFALAGYGARVANEALKKKARGSLPAWNRWPSLLKTGLIITLIEIAYLLPAALAFAATAGPSLLALANGTGDLLAPSGRLAAGMLTAFVLALLGLYALPMAMMHFVKTKKVGAAFAYRTILKKVLRMRYLGAWLFTAAYALILSLTAETVAALTQDTIIVPWIADGFFGAVTLITLFYIYGRIYKS